MLIKVLKVERIEKGDYALLKVGFVNGDGKVMTQTVPSFLSQDVFAAMSNAEAESTWEVKSKKNEKGVWNWVEAVRSNETIAETPAAKPTFPSGRTGGSFQSKSAGGKDYETKEERAVRQQLICRQNALTNAVAHCEAVGSGDIETVLKVAALFAAWSLEPMTTKPKASSFKDMSDDIPY